MFKRTVTTQQLEEIANHFKTLYAQRVLLFIICLCSIFYLLLNYFSAFILFTFLNLSFKLNYGGDICAT